MAASDLFVLALVVLCIAVVALAALRSREKTNVPSSDLESVGLPPAPLLEDRGDPDH